MYALSCSHRCFFAHGPTRSMNALDVAPDSPQSQGECGRVGACTPDELGIPVEDAAMAQVFRYFSGSSSARIFFSAARRFLAAALLTCGLRRALCKSDAT